MRASALFLLPGLLLGCGGQSEGLGSDAAVDTATAPDVAADTSTAADSSASEAGDAGLGSRCVVDNTGVTCQSESLSLSDSITTRLVTYETPLGTPPSAGWPTVIYFQGSFLPGHTAFAAVPTAAFGMYELTLTIKALLDGGYAVLSPDATADGSTYWETNIPPYATDWSGCPDDVLMNNIFSSISGGAFGPLDSGRLYAMGLSSGGFMTSRMAVSYPGKFRALADHSGSYATCGPTCYVPTPLPVGHPPILFLHGDEDTIVPMTSVQPYLDALNAESFTTKLVTDPTAGHQWLDAGPTVIPAWFGMY
jgi:poly(3-hydroxyoctanoate) depolymerase